MEESNKMPTLDHIVKLCSISASYSGGKSWAIPNMFEKWYSEGNRMPSYVGIRYLDFEGLFKDIPDELYTKLMNAMWFSMKHGCPISNAVVYIIEDKEEVPCDAS